MSSKTHSRSSIPSRTLSRRTFLAASGTGLAVGVAGCTAEADPSATPTSSSPGQNGIHPQYGFIGESMDTPAPVEPDHEVSLLIKESEMRPVPEFYFEPTGLFVESGDVVKFNFETPDHAVASFHPGLGRTARIPDGVPSLASPTMTPGTYWLFRFETPGVYDLYCPPHETFGMVMRVVVDEVSGPGAEPVSTEPAAHGQPRPPMATAAAILNDEALSPEAIIEAGSILWDSISAESKQPVE